MSENVKRYCDTYTFGLILYNFTHCDFRFFVRYCCMWEVGSYVL